LRVPRASQYSILESFLTGVTPVGLKAIFVGSSRGFVRSLRGSPHRRMGNTYPCVIGDCCGLGSISARKAPAYSTSSLCSYKLLLKPLLIKWRPFIALICTVRPIFFPAPFFDLDRVNGCSAQFFISDLAEFLTRAHRWEIFSYQTI
jgi:hypothetical protein